MYNIYIDNKRNFEKDKKIREEKEKEIFDEKHKIMTKSLAFNYQKRIKDFMINVRYDYFITHI
jgi:hypothetical protein